LQNDEISKIIKLLENFGNNNDQNKLNELLEELDTNPNDHKLRFELAEIYLKANEIEKGFQELLYIFDQNQKWNEEAAKKKLLEYFDLLGFNDPNVISARKKLSSLMFK
jgi:putative thioredoxin